MSNFFTEDNAFSVTLSNHVKEVTKMKYIVYEVFPDGKKFFRFENDDRFECEVYVDHHKYDHRVSKLVIEER